MGLKPNQISRCRLDRLLVSRGLAPTREKARAMILSGSVLVNEHEITKAGTLIASEAPIRIKEDTNPYVSRGGLKLEGALAAFDIDVSGLIALDVGASTGGFTDCLLQKGIKKVYAIDVGYGQFAWQLRTDHRVCLFERTNIRYFTGKGIDEKPDIAVIDVSFISLKLVLPVVIDLIHEEASIIALIKPQFEAGRKEVGKKGVVKDPFIHKRIIDELTAYSETLGLHVLGVCESPIFGPAGNKEFFMHVKKYSTLSRDGNIDNGN